MKDSVLVRLCRILTKNDFRALRKTVRSPYFNQREDVQRLLDYLSDHLEGDEKRLDRIQISKYVFPNEAFDMPRLRYAASFLLAIIRQFLALEEMWQDGAMERVYLNQALKRRGGEALVGRELGESFAANEKQPLRNARFQLVDYQLKTEDYLKNMNLRRNNDFDLDGLIRSFSAFQVSEILKLASTVMAHKNFTGKAHSLPFLPQAVALVESGVFQEDNCVMVLFHAMKCLESPENQSNFRALRDLLPTLGNQMNSTEIAELFIAALNFGTRRLNSGDSDYLRENFELYRTGLSTGALLPNGVLSRHIYRNIMVVGARLKEDAWVRQFLDDYQQYLPEREREDTYRFNLAFFLYFHRSDYDNAMSLLQQVVQFGDPLHNLDSRRMLVRIFYETKAWSALESQIESYKAYLRRHKEIGYHREHHLHFIQIVQKMMYSDLTNSQNRQKLRQKVEAETALAEKEWLLKQLK